MGSRLNVSMILFQRSCDQAQISAFQILPGEAFDNAVDHHHEFFAGPLPVHEHASLTHGIKLLST